MNLKRQILLISLVLISLLPWAGCQFVQEVESTLRGGQEQSSRATAQAIARSLQSDHSVVELLRRDDTASEQGIVFKPAPLALVIDGYAGELWDDAILKTASDSSNAEQTVSYRALNRDGQLILFFSIRDQDLNFYNPTKPERADQLILLLGGDETTRPSRRFALSSSSPGRINVRELLENGQTRRENAIIAHWQDTVGGFDVEVSIPISISEGRLGFWRHDTDRTGKLVEYGSVSPATKVAPRVIYTNETLAARLTAFEEQGQRLAIVDRNGLTVAERGAFDNSSTKTTYWALRSIYSMILALPERAYPFADKKTKIENRYQAREEVTEALQQRSSQHWYRGLAYSNRTILSTAVPLVWQGETLGALLLEHNSEQFLALTDSAFTRLLVISFALIALTLLVLLAYASWLSVRIRRLSHAAKAAIADDGTVSGEFPESNALDEIGDLTRSYGDMVDRVAEYTDYLQSLARKLSHELRTPLAVVLGSLENLQSSQLPEDSRRFVDRAKDGTAQLSHILTAMSEATRVEESISQADTEEIDLLLVLGSVTQAYSDLYTQHTITYQAPKHVESLHMQLAPELLVQMLDKLMENAADFAPAGSSIIVGCIEREDHVEISVSNEGSRLSDAMQTQLFQKMVSVRDDENNGTHLGLGLHIVKLIAEFHNGTVRAYNLINKAGVCFEVRLPLSSDN